MEESDEELGNMHKENTQENHKKVAGFLNGSIVGLQCCVCFRCIAMSFHCMYTYIYIYIYFQILFPYRLL